MHSKHSWACLFIVVLIALIGASAKAETWSQTRIFLQFSSVPSFDTTAGNVLENPGLNQAVKDTLLAYSCYSLTKRFIYTIGDNFAKWYIADMAQSIDPESLSHALVSTGAVQGTDLICVDCTYEPSTFEIQDSSYMTGQRWLFETLRLDSALAIEQGDSSIVIAVFCKDQLLLEWGHPDLSPNIWAYPGEDINQNGIIDDWPVTETRDGVTGDFDGVDNDRDGRIDNLIGGPWSSSLLSQRRNSGFEHETAVAGVAAAASNLIGGLGSCPKCRIAALELSGGVGNTYFDDDLVWALYHGLRIINRSWSNNGSALSSTAQQALATLLRNNGALFVAAGNDFRELRDMNDTSRALITVSGIDSFFRPIATYSDLVEKAFGASRTLEPEVQHFVPIVESMFAEAWKSVKTWHLFVRLDGIIYTADPFPFGRHLLLQMNEANMGDLFGRFDNVLVQAGRPKQDRDCWKERVIGKLRTDDLFVDRPYLRLEVEGEAERVQEMAPVVGGPILHILTFLLQKEFSIDDKARLRLESNLGRQVVVRPMVTADNKDVSIVKKWLLEYEPTLIDNAAIDHLKTQGLIELAGLVGKLDSSEIEQLMLQSLSYFYNGYVGIDPLTEFVNYITILETFLSPSDRDQLSTTVAEGLALLIESDLDRRLELRTAAKNLYSIRSKITHGKLSSVSGWELYQARLLTSRLMDVVFSRRAEWKTRAELARFIDRVKFS